MIYFDLLPCFATLSVVVILKLGISSLRLVEVFKLDSLETKFKESHAHYPPIWKKNSGLQEEAQGSRLAKNGSSLQVRTLFPLCSYTPATTLQ